MLLAPFWGQVFKPRPFKKIPSCHHTIISKYTSTAIPRDTLPLDILTPQIHHYELCKKIPDMLISVIFFTPSYAIFDFVTKFPDMLILVLYLPIAMPLWIVSKNTFLITGFLITPLLLLCWVLQSSVLLCWPGTVTSKEARKTAEKFAEFCHTILWQNNRKDTKWPGL